VRLADLSTGVWQLCQQQGWPDNQSWRNLVSWCWQVADRKYIVVLNLADSRSQGHIIPPWDDLHRSDWRLFNLLPKEDFGQRNGKEMSTEGLYVDVAPQSFQFLQLLPL
jgi:hypothetical protein